MVIDIPKDIVVTRYELFSSLQTTDFLTFSEHLSFALNINRSFVEKML